MTEIFGGVGDPNDLLPREREPITGRRVAPRDAKRERRVRTRRLPLVAGAIGVGALAAAAAFAVGTRGGNGAVTATAPSVTATVDTNVTTESVGTAVVASAPPCELLTQTRAESVIGSGNDTVFNVSEPGSTHCTYNSLVQSNGSLNGGNVDLAVDTAPFQVPEGATELRIGDGAWLRTNGANVTLQFHRGDVVVTIFVTTSENNPAVNPASVRAPLEELARAVARDLG